MEKLPVHKWLVVIAVPLHLQLISIAPCVVDGETHPSGSTFPAPDGCNTWYVGYN